jgi:hypothetical protein
MLEEGHIGKLVERAGEKGIRTLKKQLKIKRSGNLFPMNTTTSLLESLKTELSPSGFLYTLKIKGNNYGLFLDKGFETPFSGVYSNNSSGGAAAWDSKYIEGLILWGMKKFGWNYKYAKKKAFAIAKTNLAKHGKSSPKSKGWVEEVKPKMNRDIASHLQTNVLTAIDKEVNRVLNRKITTRL